VHLERGADAEQHVGACGQVVGALQRGLGQHLAEEDDVGLERVAVVAARDAVRRCLDALQDVSRSRRTPSTRQTECSMVPWTSTKLPGPGLAVQRVDVLGDDAVEAPAALELDQRRRAPVGRLLAQPTKRSP
jgi:hypothetical protein